MKNILSVEKTLKLNDEEVHELLNIFQRRLQSLARNGDVFLGSHRLSNTLAKDQLGGTFNQSNGSEGNPNASQKQAHGRNVAKGQNGSESSGESDSCNTGIFPLDELVYNQIGP